MVWHSLASSCLMHGHTTDRNDGDQPRSSYGRQRSPRGLLFFVVETSACLLGALSSAVNIDCGLTLVCELLSVACYKVPAEFYTSAL